MEDKDIINMLSRNEIELLKRLFLYQADSKVVTNEQLIRKENEKDNVKMNEVGVKRALMYLENKGLVELSKQNQVVYVITERGRKIVKQGLPEERLFSWLRSVGKGVRVSEISKASLDKSETNIALGELKKLGLITVDKGFLTIKKSYDYSHALPIKKVLQKIMMSSTGQVNDIKDDKVKKELIKRGLIEKKEKEILTIKLTPLSKKMKNAIKTISTNFIDRVTRDVIINKEWKGKSFRAYDVESPVPDIDGGRKHPLRLVSENVRDVFREMGFQEMKGDWVDLVFWNMDAMFIPQDHPARDVQDTFYLGIKGKIYDKELVRKVKEVHETGGTTGSKGWRFLWDENVTKELILRSHTTCLSFRVLAAGISPPVKYFSIGRVFRNEAIDKFHLPEFHQIEGFIAADGLTMRDLFGYIREFYDKMGINKLRFKPTYNPYTEPSAEIFAYHNTLNKWIEVGNSGMFRPESLAPYNINVPVIAWGLALERLAMLMYNLNDIRKLIGHTCDVNWLRNYKIPEFKL